MSLGRPHSVLFGVAAVLGMALLCGVALCVSPRPLAADSTAPATVRSGQSARFAGELGQQLAALQQRWATQGIVRVRAPVLLERGARYPVPFPVGALSGDSRGCATAVLLGAVNVSFIAQFSDQGSALVDTNWPVPSAAGVAQVTRCGAEKAQLAQLQIHMRSRRGVIEVLTFESQHAPEEVTTFLRGRDAGSSSPAPHIGPRPFLAPRSTRIAHLHRWAMEFGIASWTEYTVLGDDTGRGDHLLNLAEGCHWLFFLAPQDKQATPDLDALLSDLVRGEVHAGDDEQSSDARLFHCTGQSTRVRASFSGANPNTEILLAHAERPLPSGLPLVWGGEARAKVAQTLHLADAPWPSNQPIFAALGVRGETALPLDVAPNACYLVVAVPLRGESRRLGLRLDVESVKRDAQAMRPQGGAALSFCSEQTTRARLWVHSVGTSVTWLCAMWKTTDPLQRTAP